MAKSDYISQILARLPQQPGVYQYFDDSNRLLYVGKAKNLKKRVASYFTKQNHNGKTRLLVSKITDIKWLIAPSESDALLLENSLIKEHRPLYNITYLTKINRFFSLSPIIYFSKMMYIIYAYTGC